MDNYNRVPRICVDFASAGVDGGIPPAYYPPGYTLPVAILKQLSEGNDAKRWTRNTTIKVFLGDSSQINSTPLEELENKVDESGRKIPMDPLQLTILKDYTNMKDRVIAVVQQRIQPIVSLMFVFQDTPKGAHVKVSFDPTQSCWSAVGKDCLKREGDAPTMNLGWFDVGTVVHEFCHVLGMIHGENSPDGYEINWDDSAVCSWAYKSFGWSRKETDKNILIKYGKGTMRGPGYDPASIMRYFYPSRFTKNKKEGVMNMQLSREDVKWIHNSYPGGLTTLDDFYQDSYGVPYTLDNRKVSSKLKDPSPSPHKTINYIFIILLVVSVITITCLIVWGRNKKRRGK
jgi:hypothetical protein